MTPRTRSLHDAQVSLHRQQQQLDERYQRESQKLAQAVEEDLVNRFRSSLRAVPATAEEEARLLLRPPLPQQMGLQCPPPLLDPGSRRACR